MLLVIDNYDSFTYNLVQYLGELGAEMEVRRNDEVTLEEIENQIKLDSNESRKRLSARDKKNITTTHMLKEWTNVMPERIAPFDAARKSPNSLPE